MEIIHSTPACSCSDRCQIITFNCVADVVKYTLKHYVNEKTYYFILFYNILLIIQERRGLEVRRQKTTA